MEKIRLGALPSLARSVLERLPGTPNKAVIVALQGDLGAGKTTFVQALARELGVQETVQSPTYVLMKSYPISYKNFTRLIHIDTYRFNSATEFTALKPENFLSDPHALVCIEWPEKVAGAFPEPSLTIQFSLNLPAGKAGGAKEGERYITIYNDPE